MSSDLDVLGGSRLSATVGIGLVSQHGQVAVRSFVLEQACKPAPKPFLWRRKSDFLFTPGKDIDRALGVDGGSIHAVSPAHAIGLSVGILKPEVGGLTPCKTQLRVGWVCSRHADGKRRIGSHDP